MLYRRHRPNNFAQVMGQDIIVKILRNFLKNRDRLPQGYLFAGTRGTGKTTTARLFAKALNCANNLDEPCNECQLCQAINKNQFLDLIEMDAASQTGVDNIRNLKEGIGFKPIQGKYKVFILDEAHMLSTAAWNALLKTLEEPPAGVIFILATTEPEKIPATILSRVQRFDFRRAGVKEVTAKLSHIAAIEQIPVEAGALHLIAEEAQGSFRDAETLLEKLALCVPSGSSVTEGLVEEFLGKLSQNKIIEFLEFLFKQEAKACLDFISATYEAGFDLHLFNRSLMKLLRELLILKIHPHWQNQLQRDYPTEFLQRLRNLSEQVSADEVKKTLRIFSEAENLLKREPPVATLPLELAVAELTSEMKSRVDED